MRKTRIIIINRTRHKLYVQYQRCGQTDWQEIHVKKKKVLKLISGHFAFMLSYQDANLELDKGMKGVKDYEQILSFVNPKYQGVKVLVADTGRKIQLKCKERTSVAELIETLL